jgi:hypothetical protein
MTMPDFLILDFTSNKLNKAFFVDVKYRDFGTYENFEKSIKNDGEIYRQAEKYKDLWGEYTFIFLIAKYNNKMHTYYDSVNHICESNFINELNKEKYPWLHGKELVLDEYKVIINKFLN